MPTYDYVCANCGLEVEVVHSILGHGPSSCASCGGPMKKAIVASAVHFKGSGWARKQRSESPKSPPASSEPQSSPTSGGVPPQPAPTVPTTDSTAKDAD